MKKKPHHYPMISISRLKEEGLFSYIGEGYITLNIAEEDEEEDLINGYFSGDIDSIEIIFKGDGFYSRVELVTTIANLGGKRWWFLCPQNKMKCTKLYVYEGGFASGKYMDFSYYTPSYANTFLYLNIQEKANILISDIKYPYRNRKQTKKFKRIVEMYKKINLPEQYAYEDYLFSRSIL